MSKIYKMTITDGRPGRLSHTNPVLDALSELEHIANQLDIQRQYRMADAVTRAMVKIAHVSSMDGRRDASWLEPKRGRPDKGGLINWGTNWLNRDNDIEDKLDNGEELEWWEDPFAQQTLEHMNRQIAYPLARRTQQQQQPFQDEENKQIRQQQNKR